LLNGEEHVSEQEPMNGPEPIPERLISDVETLRALSDPLRLRILEVMTATPDETYTVKRLASILGTSQTRLYHHVNQLAERDLIVVAGQRVVSGIIETSYRVGQRNVRLDRRLLAADASTMHDTLTTIFDGARDDIERGLRAGTISTAEDADPASKLLLARGLARLSRERAAELRARLAALFDEFSDEDGQAAAPGLPAFGLVLSMYAMPEPTESEETER
jgi:DNA-binding transcriptional ArsR family regulator